MDLCEIDDPYRQRWPDSCWYTWDKHSNATLPAEAKGLHNAPGENNCFVNCAVQIFWHLDVFRRSFRLLSGHLCMGNSCIFCALKENILKRIHYHLTTDCHEDLCTATHCLSHQKFSLRIFEQIVCPCGAGSKPMKFSEMVHYVSVKELVSQAQRMQETGDILHQDRFGLLIRSANATGDIRDCPGGCGRRVQIIRTLLNSPDVLCIGLVWDSGHPTTKTTTEVAKTIGTSILLQDVFHTVMTDYEVLPKLRLVGLVCYHGKHYSTFVFHSRLQVWIYFDDAAVTEIGKCWDDVVDKCIIGKYQPLLLLYANPNAMPIVIETAPKKRIMASGYDAPAEFEEESTSDGTEQHPFFKPQAPGSQPATEAVPTPVRNSEKKKDRLPMKSANHQQNFIRTMSNSKKKLRHLLKFRSQSGTNEQETEFVNQLSNQCDSLSSPQTQLQNNNFVDSTLSTSCLNKRLVQGNVKSLKLPHSQNIKICSRSQRKGSLRKVQESIGVDVVRYQVGPSKAQFNNVQHEQQNCDDLSQTYEIVQSVNSSPSPWMSNHDDDYQQFKQQIPLLDCHLINSCQEDQLQCTYMMKVAGSKKNDNGGLLQSPTALLSAPTIQAEGEKQTSEDLSCYQERFEPPTQGKLNLYSGSDRSYKSTAIESDPSIIGNISSLCIIRRTEMNSSKKIVECDRKMQKNMKVLMKDEKQQKILGNSSLQSNLPEIVKASMNYSECESSDMYSPYNYCDDMKYIDRRMVESILKHQGVQRQTLVCSTNSISSINSDSVFCRKQMAGKNTEDGLPSDLSCDSASVGSCRDSGYNSSDAHIISFTAGATEQCYQSYITDSVKDPCLQSCNTDSAKDPCMQTCIADKAKDPCITDSATELCTQSFITKKIMAPKNFTSKVTQPVIVDSLKENLTFLPKFQTPCTVARPCMLSSSENVSLVQKSPPNPAENKEIDCINSVCARADDMMDHCIIEETNGDLTSAIHFCDAALGCLTEALCQPGITNKAQIYAFKNSCILKSRNLSRRASVNGIIDRNVNSEMRLCTNSSGDISTKGESYGNHLLNSCSRKILCEQTDQFLQGQTDSTSLAQEQLQVMDTPAHLRIHHCKDAPSHVQAVDRVRTSPATQGKPAEVNTALVRPLRRASDPTGSSNIYLAYLNRQRGIQNDCASDSNKIDIVKRKMNQAEIRELMDKRQSQQFASQHKRQRNKRPGFRQKPVETQFQHASYTDIVEQEPDCSADSVNSGSNMPSEIQSDKLRIKKPHINPQFSDLSIVSCLGLQPDTLNCPSTVSIVQTLNQFVSSQLPVPKTDTVCQQSNYQSQSSTCQQPNYQSQSIINQHQHNCQTSCSHHPHKADYLSEFTVDATHAVISDYTMSQPSSQEILRHSPKTAAENRPNIYCPGNHYCCHSQTRHGCNHSPADSVNHSERGTDVVTACMATKQKCDQHLTTDRKNSHGSHQSEMCQIALPSQLSVPVSPPIVMNFAADASVQTDIIQGNGVNNASQTSDTQFFLGQMDHDLHFQQLSDSTGQTQPNLDNKNNSSCERSPQKPAIKPKPAALCSKISSKPEVASKTLGSPQKNTMDRNSLFKSVAPPEDSSNFAGRHGKAAELISASVVSFKDQLYFSNKMIHQDTTIINHTDDEEDSSSSDSLPLVNEEFACQLCHKREIERGKSYCTNCSSYLVHLSPHIDR